MNFVRVTSTSRDARLSRGTNMTRIALLTVVLFFASFSAVSAQQDLEGMILVPKNAMSQFFNDVKELQNINRTLADELIKAQDTIKFGMGCT